MIAYLYPESAIWTTAIGCTLIGFCAAHAIRAIRKYMNRPRKAATPLQSYLEDINTK